MIQRLLLEKMKKKDGEVEEAWKCSTPPKRSLSKVYFSSPVTASIPDFASISPRADTAAAAALARLQENAEDIKSRAHHRVLLPLPSQLKDDDAPRKTRCFDAPELSQFSTCIIFPRYSGSDAVRNSPRGRDRASPDSHSSQQHGVPSCHRRHRRRRTSAAAAAEKNDTTTTTIAQHGRAFQHLFLSSEFSQRNESFALTRFLRQNKNKTKMISQKRERNAYYRQPAYSTKSYFKTATSHKYTRAGYSLLWNILWSLEGERESLPIVVAVRELALSVAQSSRKSRFIRIHYSCLPRTRRLGQLPST